MATADRLVDDLRSIFDDARKTSGQVQAEALLAAAPFVLKGAEHARDEVAYMRDRVTRESYQAICRSIGDEIDRLNAEIARLQHYERMASVMANTQRRFAPKPATAAVTPPAAE
ncbi:hypothetical protein Snov_0722 [Ancylobacter novellus DSM 506]|uniref:Uncharacterized protein n=2 Tax=Ancylobacter novellus TaxID=921 RepID=D7A505_ANCN5|nr:hypothetical protein Snov_0722 [Ancylobacter novellus DSM 506]